MVSTENLLALFQLDDSEARSDTRIQLREKMEKMINKKYDVTMAARWGGLGSLIQVSNFLMVLI